MGGNRVFIPGALTGGWVGTCVFIPGAVSEALSY